MARTLIVCVPGLRKGLKNWSDMLDLLLHEPEQAGAEVFRWDHGCGYVSTKSAASLSVSLAAAIDGEWQKAKQSGKAYERIILMGHSAGASLLRQAYLIGLGSSLKKLAPQEWATAVKRIVLFAGLNRGLFPPEDPGVPKAPYRIRRWLGRHTIEFFSEIPLLHLLAEDLLAGSDFVTNLRLWWIRKFDSMQSPPTVVQLVGTDDAIVRSSDSLDIEQDRGGNQILIADANHANIIQMKDQHGKTLEARYAQVRRAVLETFPDTPSPVSAQEQAQPVVFVVHGIRTSNGTWVKDAGESIKSAMPAARIVEATYWYFSALDFTLPILRKRKIRWFMDTYSYYLARGPRAPFHFLGHSNGTYLLGQSLRRLSGMQFERVVLAGSVLPRDFQWQFHLDGKQVAQIWNHRASRDVPVAVLCNALRGLGMHDVGTGGFEGFAADTRIHECFYHRGGHSAALGEAPLHRLTEQVAGVSPVTAECVDLARSATRGFERLSGISFLLPYVALVVLLGLAYWSGGILAQHVHYGLIAARSIAGALLTLVLGVVLKFL